MEDNKIHIINSLNKHKDPDKQRIDKEIIF
jgi:hypothetical protein